MKKKTIMKSFLLSLMMVMATGVEAQTMVYYSYDASGNRVTRSTTIVQTRGWDSDLEDKDKKQGSTEKIHIIQHMTEDKISVEIVGWSNDVKASFGIFNTSGVLLLKKDIVGMRTDIDLATFIPGVYILCIETGEEKDSWKIIKK